MTTNDPRCLVCTVRPATLHGRPRLIDGVCNRCAPHLNALEVEMFSALSGNARPERRLMWEAAFSALGEGPERDCFEAYASGALWRRVRVAA